MTPRHASANSCPRPLRLRRWRSLLAGAGIACVGLAAAQAASLNLLHFDLLRLSNTAADERPIAIRASGGHRSYSTALVRGEQPGMFVAKAGAAPAVETPRAEVQGVQNPGVAMMDADLFALAHGATLASVAASPEPRQLGGRFHGALMSGGSASDRPDYGGQGGRAHKGLADCCEDSAAQTEGSLLTQPVIAEALSGPIPESATWALMIVGFGLSGVVLRGERRRRT